MPVTRGQNYAAVYSAYNRQKQEDALKLAEEELKGQYEAQKALLAQLMERQTALDNHIIEMEKLYAKAASGVAGQGEIRDDLVNAYAGVLRSEAQTSVERMKVKASLMAQAYDESVPNQSMNNQSAAMADLASDAVAIVDSGNSSAATSSVINSINRNEKIGSTAAGATGVARAKYALDSYESTISTLINEGFVPTADERARIKSTIYQRVGVEPDYYNKNNVQLAQDAARHAEERASRLGAGVNSSEFKEFLFTQMQKAYGVSTVVEGSPEDIAQKKEQFVLNALLDDGVVSREETMQYGRQFSEGPVPLSTDVADAEIQRLMQERAGDPRLEQALEIGQTREQRRLIGQDIAGTGLPEAPSYEDVYRRAGEIYTRTRQAPFGGNTLAESRARQTARQRGEPTPRQMAEHVIPDEQKYQWEGHVAARRLLEEYGGAVPNLSGQEKIDWDNATAFVKNLREGKATLRDLSATAEEVARGRYGIDATPEQIQSTRRELTKWTMYQLNRKLQGEAFVNPPTVESGIISPDVQGAKLVQERLRLLMQNKQRQRAAQREKRPPRQRIEPVNRLLDEFHVPRYNLSDIDMLGLPDVPEPTGASAGMSMTDVNDLIDQLSIDPDLLSPEERAIYDRAKQKAELDRQRRAAP